MILIVISIDNGVEISLLIFNDTINQLDDLSNLSLCLDSLRYVHSSILSPHTQGKGLTLYNYHYIRADKAPKPLYHADPGRILTSTAIYTQ